MLYKGICVSPSTCNLPGAVAPGSFPFTSSRTMIRSLSQNSCSSNLGNSDNCSASPFALLFILKPPGPLIKGKNKRKNGYVDDPNKIMFTCYHCQDGSYTHRPGDMTALGASTSSKD